ncbi:MAG: hypothetical protein EOM08_01415 [Clostridia bacterium]|nr:hypothetical protein [Clostridia bacterium]NCC75074.1 hypothetical protein [Clostridia bacterium]
MLNQTLSTIALATRGSLDRFADRPDFMFNSGLGWVGLILHGLFNLAIIAALVVLIVHLVRSGKRNKLQAAHAPGTNTDSPVQATTIDPAASALTILNERYAKGEVSEEDYSKIKKNLTE